MLHELGRPAEMTAEELYGAYRAALRATVEAAGADAAAADAGTGPDALDALVDPEVPDAEVPELTLEEAGALLALDPDADADGEGIAALARDAILIGMSSAVVDVEVLASRLDGDLEPREIQSKIEGRFPMTLREFARIHAHLESQVEG